jgi:outer membrane protein
MKGMRLIGAAVLVAAGIVVGTWMGTPTTSAQGASGSRVAILDVQRVLARSAAGVSAREQLEKDRGTMQKQADGQRSELEKMKDELDKKGQLLSPEARREKQEALERKARDFRRLIDDLQASLQKKEEALVSRVLQDLSGLVQKVGKEKGYSLILERSKAGVLYAATDSDVTDEVLKAYDDQTKKKP